MIQGISFLIVGLVGLLAIPLATAASEWDVAEKNIVRLHPDKFSQLPPTIMKDLTNRGCTVPQTWVSKKTHNAIEGEFAKKGQKDWAVLCSKAGVSSIIVFWGGSEKCSPELRSLPDKSFLQGTGSGIAYSRLLSPVCKDFIDSQFKAYGGPKPPAIDHQGINDEFMDKASIVHYCKNGQWLKLTGSD